MIRNLLVIAHKNYFPAGRSVRNSVRTPMSSLTSTKKDLEPLDITPDSKCEGCCSIGEAMSEEEVKLQRNSLTPEWTVGEDYKSLSRSIKVKNFATALDYINKIGVIAEAENHHPDLTIRSYNHVEITLSTHALKGITANDFILAVKIDTIPVLSKAKKKHGP